MGGNEDYVMINQLLLTNGKYSYSKKLPKQKKYIIHRIHEISYGFGGPSEKMAETGP
jgi:hypothetical protein